MKRSELDILIRTIVKEEIAHSIPVILSEMAKAMNPQQVTTTISSNNNGRSMLQENTYQPVRKPSVIARPPAKRALARNPVLNAILNSTPSLAASERNAGMLPPAEVYQNNEDNYTPQGPMQMMDEDSVDISNGIPAPQVNYADFLKKMDAAAARNRPV